MKFICLVLCLGLCIPSAFAGRSQSFAEKLQKAGYHSRSIFYFEKALKAGEVKDKDEVYLSLFKLFGKLADNTKDSGKAAAHRKTAKDYFDKILNKNRPEVQLEIVAASLASLNKLKTKLHDPRVEKTAADIKQIKKQARTAFNAMSGVVDKIRKDARTWIDKVEELDDKERRKVKDTEQKKRMLEANANLKFGEACALFAAVCGHRDPEVRKWLLEMVKGYQDFISQVWGTPYAITGGIYLGEVNILLGKYKDAYETDVDGVEIAESSFSEVEAGLEELKKYKGWYNDQMYLRFKKHADALNIIGKKEASAKILADMFKWKAPSDVDYSKDKNFHFRLMISLEQRAKLLIELYKSGNKKIVNELSKAILDGFNVTKKMDSPFHANFKILMAELPTDESVDETADLAFLRGKDLFNKASKLEGQKNYAMYFAAAEKLKKALAESIKEGPEKMLDVYPEAAFKLGYSYYQMKNYLLALGTYIRALDLFPASKYPEDKFKDTYSAIKKCAQFAKVSASKRYNSYGKNRFDQDLYGVTLQIISKQFPEEGGDPEYWLGLLKKDGEQYSEAKKSFGQIAKDNPIYLKAQYHIVDCDYKKLKDDAKEGRQINEKQREKVVSSFIALQKLAEKKITPPKNISAKDLKKMKEARTYAIGKCASNLSELYTKSEKYEEAIKAIRDSLDQVSGVSKRNMLSRLVTSYDKVQDLEGVKFVLAYYEKMPVTEDYSQEKKNKNIASTLNRLGNLIGKVKRGAIETKMASASKDEAKKLEVELNNVHEEMGDLYWRSLQLTGKKDRTTLSLVITYYLTSKKTAPKALKALNLYFKWYPNKPELDLWYESMLGKSMTDWDVKVGAHLNAIKVVSVQNKYREFLDALFDNKEYGKMKISQVRKVKKESKDNPRSYSDAAKILAELGEMQNKDFDFKRKVYPELQKLEEKVTQANGYYGMRYQQANCLTQLQKYSEASSVFTELSKYYVEYFDIRIEAGKAAYAQGSYDSAVSNFSDLLRVVPKPGSSTYNPKDFFSLWLWSTKAKIASYGKNPDMSKVIKTWKLFRSMALVMDPGYLSKDPLRLGELGIKSQSRAAHYALCDETQKFCEEEIFPLLKKSSEANLKNDSWEKVIAK
ncbi:MAG: hypothetical protein HQL32_02435 [Planctomycetes bacterium]|nr:hypothetical protein [Planctomycetota bacterium]